VKMSEYSFATKSSLKLKGVDNPEIKKKKKKKKDKERKEKEMEAVKERLEQEAAGGSGTSKEDDMNGEDFGFYKKKTKNEIAFLKKKEERDIDRIKKKADMNHRSKVEKFNQYLNGLSEHYDIPKVSWTK